jgi:AcrR family transcriptional regulator
MQIAEMQRARLISAAALAVGELGWSGMTVAHVTSRARVSRRTFYDLFEDREDCLLAVLEDVVERIEGEITAAGLDEGDWTVRVRDGLFAVLSFFDREPGLAGLCVVQSLCGGPRVLEYREGVLARLVRVLDQGRSESSRSRGCTVLTAEGLVGGAFAIVYARLLANKHQEPLTSLLGELMSLIVLPYRGPAAAGRERDRALPALSKAAGHGAHEDTQSVFDPLRDIPMRAIV